MVLFDLNNGRSATAAGMNAAAYDGVDFPGSMPVLVKSVKRLSSHPWPFSVKSGAVQENAETTDGPHHFSSFVT